MKTAEYIAEFLADRGVTDAFGIPGGVVLDFIYALEDSGRICPHLNYHEQCSVFAAAGYAQAGGIAGIAYVTRGPGIMNTVTAVADAYCDSVPLIVFTAHERRAGAGKMRVMNNQEFNLQPVFSTITKYFARVDRIGEVRRVIQEAFYLATTGRKGPAVIDMAACLWNEEITEDPEADLVVEAKSGSDMEVHIQDIMRSILHSSRPVILAGDGVRQSGMEKYLAEFAQRNQIPVLTSRYSQDLLAGNDLYYGYIGSHAVRSANFILSKADLIIGLGNRMAFPVDSKSFAPVVHGCKIIRVDVDPSEFERRIPGTQNIIADLTLLMPWLAQKQETYANKTEWLEVCGTLRESLKDYDINDPVSVIADILRRADGSLIITSDVGNNELWLSRAYQAAGRSSRILYSKTFGALGCSVAKAVGAYYACRKPVLCFTGDQGLQMNVQELQAVGAGQLPIAVIVVNNESSGMIRSSEKKKFNGRFVHTTKSSGYRMAGLEYIAGAYGMEYLSYAALSEEEKTGAVSDITRPLLIEVSVDEDNDVAPTLRCADACQKLFPYIDEGLFEWLESL